MRFYIIKCNLPYASTEISYKKSYKEAQFFQKKTIQENFG